MNDLARVILDSVSDAPLGAAIGVVTATAPFTIRLNGDTTDIVSPPRSDGYTPTIGDRVFVLRPGGTGVVVAFKFV